MQTISKPPEIQDSEIETCDSSTQPAWLRIVKEPLLHFVVAGAAIYLLFGLFGQPSSHDAIVEENTIVITEGEMEWLAEMWQKKWNRPPTKEEMLGLVRENLKETVLYREAISMGLDKDDVIIRRRLAQKLEFLSQDLIQPKPATDEELLAFFNENVDHYQIPPVITFSHVFLDPDKREDQTLADAEKLKAELITDSIIPDQTSDLGDRFMLQSYYPERTEGDLSKLFGSEFAHSLIELESKKWHGPVLSGYGTHLVFVHAHEDSPVPTYEQVAERVREDHQNEQREQLNNDYIQSLLRRYTVTIEGEDSEGDSADSAETSE